MSFALLLIINGRPSPRASTRSISGTQQSAFFSYWSEADGFRSTVAVNNASDTQLTVTPTLFNLYGQPLALSPMVVAARQQRFVNVADWLAEGNASPDFGQGNLILSYEAPDAAYIGAQVTVTNSGSSLSFDFRDEMPMSFKSSRLEGMWWRPDGDSRYDLVLSNMEGTEVIASVRASGEQRRVEDTSFEVELAPHQTRIIHIDDERLPFTTTERGGKVGGISITHTGAPGAVLACGMLSKAKTGFSSHFPFEDPATSRSQVLSGAHVLIGKPDLPGFEAQSSFTSTALLRNASESEIEVRPSLSFNLNGVPRTVLASSHTLAPDQIQLLDIGAELKRLGLRGAVTGCGFTLSSSGQPGGLVAHVTGFDQTRNHAFDVPMKDPGIAMNRHSGSYPWNISDDLRSIIHVRNTRDEKARLTIQLDFEGGSYTLPLQVLEPQQEVAVDIRQLRDAQVKDGIGRVIPLEVNEGQANWSERGRQALIGRMEVFSVSRGTSSSFSCGGPCCPPDTESIYASPASFAGPVGDGGVAQAFEMQRRACDQAEFGPFEISLEVLWSSSNTQVVTVAGQQVNCVGVGQADVNVSFLGTQWLGSEVNQICEENDVPFFTSAPVTVFRLRIRTAGTSVHFEDSDNGASIVAGEAFAIIVEAINAVGDVLSNVNIGVSTSASRTLDSSEIGLPSSFNIVNGTFNSGGLLLNRVIGTQSGTTYRFATSAGGFTDFSFYTYFRVLNTRIGLVGNTTSCGHVVQPQDHFVALPVAELCGVSVVVRNPSSGQSEATTKKDKGPHFPGPGTACDPSGSMGGDFYWNTGTRPRVETLTCETGNNNSGIDLADGTFAALGSPSQVVWRFGTF